MTAVAGGIKAVFAVYNIVFAVFLSRFGDEFGGFAQKIAVALLGACLENFAFIGAEVIDDAGTIETLFTIFKTGSPALAPCEAIGYALGGGGSILQIYDDITRREPKLFISDFRAAV